jgi:low affinity Fe/Cu permease
MTTDQDGRQTFDPKGRLTFARIARLASDACGSAWAFALAAAVVAVWAVSGPFFRYPDAWQLVINTGTTITTFLMIFLVQNTQNRNEDAVQAKLDELIRATEGARDALIGVERRQVAE